MADNGAVQVKSVWYSSEEKIISTKPRLDYRQESFNSLEEWFGFIQDMVSHGYLIT